MNKKEVMNQEEKERILKCVMEQIKKEQQEQASRRSIHPRRVAAAVLAAATIFVCGAFTANVLHLDSKLAEMLGGSTGEITDAVVDIGAAVEKNGLRLEVKQAVGDGHRVYAVFEVTSLTDLKLDKTCGFADREVILPENYGYAGTDIDGAMNSVSEDGKTLSFGLEFTMDEPIYNETIAIRFENLARIFYIPDDEAEVLIKGEWTIEFPLKYKQISKIYKPDMVIAGKSGAMRLQEVEISPISCFMEFKVETYSKRLERTWTDELNPKIRMKDGREVPIWMRGTTWFDAGKDSAGSIEGVFKRPMDIEKMESLIVDGREIPLN